MIRSKIDIHCSDLNLLDVQACRLRSIDGLHALESLQSLHISHNQIEQIENLDRNVELETVDLSGNPIKALTGELTNTSGAYYFLFYRT